MDKIKVILILVVILFNIALPVFANDEEYDIENTNLNEIVQTSIESSNIPIINSRSAIIYDRTSGEVIYGKEENTKRKMASTTKIMTAIIVIENCNLSETVEVSKKAAGTGGSRLGLTSGAKITVNDLLYGLMLCSGNDAAVALAEHTAGSVQEFAVLMNKKSQELGLKQTHFVTPHGLDEDEHYTTAYELAKITDYGLKIDKFVEIVKTKHYTVTINGNSKSLSNTNELLGNVNGVYGVKTGFTNGANRCLVSAIKRDNLDIICVVLGADTKKFRTQDSIKLIEYAFKNYRLVNLSAIIESEFTEWNIEDLRRVNIVKGKEKYAYLYIDNDCIKYYPMSNNAVGKIKVDIEVKDSIDAPVNNNQKVGTLKLKIDGKEIIEKDVLAKFVPKKTYIDYFKELIYNFPIYLEEILL